MVAALLVAGCGSSVPLAADSGRDRARADGDTNGVDVDAIEARPDADGPDAARCCPIDPGMVTGGCVFLGGRDTHGCFQTCDFYCSLNWRVETDADGCPTWHMDYRAPAPGETPICFPDPDAGRDAPAEE
jgi:hypothetical protein